MTRNLKLYLAFSVVWSVAFFAALNWGLADPERRWPCIAAAGIGYGLGFAVLGFLLGRADDQSAVRYDLGRAYSAVSTSASAAIGTLWIIFFRPSDIVAVPIYLAVIAVLWIISAVQARRTIKGMSAEDLFK